MNEKIEKKWVEKNKEVATKWMEGKVKQIDENVKEGGR